MFPIDQNELNKFYLRMSLAHPIYGPINASVYFASLGVTYYASWVGLLVNLCEDLRLNANTPDASKSQRNP
jgi:hypothetical protein